MAAPKSPEEIDFDAAYNAPCLLASALRKYGAGYSCGKNWRNYIIVCSHLVTGKMQHQVFRWQKQSLSY